MPTNDNNDPESWTRKGYHVLETLRELKDAARENEHGITEQDGRSNDLERRIEKLESRNGLQNYMFGLFGTVGGFLLQLALKYFKIL